MGRMTDRRCFLYIIFICLSANGHVDCSHISPAGNNAAVATDVHTVYSRSSFHFLWNRLLGWIARSYSSSNFLKKPHTVFYEGCNILHFQQSCIRVPISPYPYQTCYCLLIHIAHHRRFQFVFPYWLVMLSIFSYICWPFVCLWRNVYWIPSPAVLVSSDCRNKTERMP